MLFRSRLCSVCDNALRLAFDGIQNQASHTVPHHVTKESLVNSVLHRSCHLCRLIVHHLKVYWAPFHQNGLDDLEEEPTTLTEDDFVDSDFDFATFPSARLVVLSYLLGLPEILNLQAQISNWGDGSDGVFGIVNFGCDAFSAETIDAAVPRFWVLDNRAFGAPPVTSRFNENTGAVSCQSLLKSWLDQCNNHDICKIQEQSFLPTRLLDLGDVELSGKVRLVLSANLDQSTRYVTLSHCWGGNVPLQLNKDTKQDMFDGFDYDSMPNTFRDAIQVARWADVRYIWIDSCCIQQDSPSDWKREAKMMRKIYKHTHFNISADHSENSRGGCFTDRLAYKMTPCPFDAPQVGRVFLVSQYDITEPLTYSPIAQRAWVTQERFLSPRVLHFTTDQLFWECAGTYACETFPHGVPQVCDNSTSWHYRAPANLPQANYIDRPTHYKVWGQICHDYSHSRLSYTSDKIIAFAGIAEEFQLRLPNDTYIAGLWKGHIIAGLLWRAMAIHGRPTQANGSNEADAAPYITAAMPAKYRAPSWSWLGKDCSIHWEWRNRFSLKELVTIQDISVDYADETDRTGDINGGSITMSGFLRSAQWRQSGIIESIVLDGKSGDQLLMSPSNVSFSESDHFTIQRDTGTSFPDVDIFCLPICTSSESGAISSDNPLIEGLILGPTSEKDCYARLGYFETVGDGYRRALFYGLKDSARGLDRPWDLMVFEEGTEGEYDGNLFTKLGESVFTIV